MGWTLPPLHSQAAAAAASSTPKSPSVSTGATWDDTVHIGSVKKVDVSKGFSVVVCAGPGFERDVYVRKQVAGPELLSLEDIVAFKLQPGVRGFPQASAPLWKLAGPRGSQARPCQLSDYQGQLYSVLPSGCGFVRSAEVGALHGLDAYIHAKVMGLCELALGDILRFNLNLGPSGKPQVSPPVWKCCSEASENPLGGDIQETLESSSGPSIPTWSGPKAVAEPGWRPKPIAARPKEVVAKEVAPKEPKPIAARPKEVAAKEVAPKEPWPSENLPPGWEGGLPPGWSAAAKDDVAAKEPLPKQLDTWNTEEPEEVTPSGAVYMGTVKSTDAARGFSMVDCPDSGFEVDVFVHCSVSDPSAICTGDIVAFQIGANSAGLPQACPPLWKLVGWNGKENPRLGEYVGHVRRIMPNGSGFVDCPEVAEAYGCETFVREAVMVACGLAPGDTVAFNVLITGAGKPQMPAPCWKCCSVEAVEEPAEDAPLAPEQLKPLPVGPVKPGSASQRLAIAVQPEPDGEEELQEQRERQEEQEEQQRQQLLLQEQQLLEQQRREQQQREEAAAQEAALAREVAARAAAAREAAAREAASRDAVSREAAVRETVRTTWAKSEEPARPKPLAARPKEVAAKEVSPKEPKPLAARPKEVAAKEVTPKGSVTKEPVAKEPLAKESKESTAKEPAAEEPSTKEPPREPAADEPAQKEPLAEEAVAEEPAAEAPVPKDEVAEANAPAEEVAAQEPASKDPSPAEPTASEPAEAEPAVRETPQDAGDAKDVDKEGEVAANETAVPEEASCAAAGVAAAAKAVAKETEVAKAVPNETEVAKEGSREAADVTASKEPEAEGTTAKESESANEPRIEAEEADSEEKKALVEPSETKKRERDEDEKSAQEEPKEKSAATERESEAHAVQAAGAVAGAAKAETPEPAAPPREAEGEGGGAQAEGRERTVPAEEAPFERPVPQLDGLRELHIGTVKVADEVGGFSKLTCPSSGFDREVHVQRSVVDPEVLARDDVVACKVRADAGGTPQATAPFWKLMGWDGKVTPAAFGAHHGRVSAAPGGRGGRVARDSDAVAVPEDTMRLCALTPGDTIAYDLANDAAGKLEVALPLWRHCMALDIPYFELPAPDTTAANETNGDQPRKRPLPQPRRGAEVEPGAEQPEGKRARASAAAAR